MTRASSRRTFVKQAASLIAFARAARWVDLAAAEGGAPTAVTSAGSVRGTVVNGSNVFKGIPYGGTTAGKNRFMPPTRPTPWTGTRDALAFGHTAPQTTGAGGSRGGGITEGEDCLVEFFIAYEFKSRVLGMLMGTMFDRAFRKFSGAFEKRADLVYGRAAMARAGAAERSGSAE